VWPYSLAGPDIIRDRSTYSATMLPGRISGIRDLIAQHRPQIVVCYGLNARDTWAALAGAEFVKSEGHSFRFCSTPSTLYILMKHPTAHGVTNAEFEALGRFVAAFEVRA